MQVVDWSKAGDLEKLHEKVLLREFEEYKEIKKKLKAFGLGLSVPDSKKLGRSTTLCHHRYYGRQELEQLIIEFVKSLKPASYSGTRCRSSCNSVWMGAGHITERLNCNLWWWR